VPGRADIRTPEYRENLAAGKEAARSRPFLRIVD
jgi:hypothetical protein